MREQLIALAKLGRIDASTQELDRKLREIPKEVDDLRQNVSLLEGLLGKEREQLAEAEALFAEQDAQIKEYQGTLARSKAKAAKARNMREAEAVERELEAVRRSMRDREAEQEKLSAAIDKVRESLTQHETEFGGLRDMLTEKDSEAQAQITELEAEKATALSGREELTAVVPREILSRYERVRSRRETGVAEAVNGTCMGCRVALRPMQFVALQKMQSIESCPNCLRYLYIEEWLDDEEGGLAPEEPAS